MKGVEVEGGIKRSPTGPLACASSVSCAELVIGANRQTRESSSRGTAQTIGGRDYRTVNLGCQRKEAISVAPPHYWRGE